ncbi:integral membrane protein [Colletotrichum karsti]|uniref:Integral membrane protein n=1 Tax=Colletotrichum karsti TaxID=1095194 RepID=A0A9P6LH41_9PEZI|nr:uncharacterized protein CkaCkLH20_10469 [Colletotrichum karsti]KAF9872132.1 integral membrane protein [Colletotrichum karsti]
MVTNMESTGIMPTPKVVRDGSLPPDETVGPIWLGVSTTLLIFLLLTTILRLWVRIARRNFGWDDTTIALAAVMATVRYTLAAMQLPHGNGRHRVYLSDYDYKMINMYGWYGQLFHFTSMACLKCSICALVLRLKDKRGMRIFVCTIIAGVIYWIYAAIAYSALTDLILSFIPLALIWKVKIRIQKKVSIMCLMSLGLIATAFGITRAAFLGVSTEDLSWTFCIVAIWSNLELFLGIIAANLALSRAIYLYFRQGSSTASKSQTDPSAAGHVNTRGHIGDRFVMPSTTISTGLRRIPSETRSSDSDIPLEPRIQKRTDFWWREDGSPQQITDLGP